MKNSTSKKSRAQTNLSKEDSVLLALRKISLSLFEAMCASEQGVKDQINPEFLHDYRIAVRRTRSLLGQMKKVIPPDKLKVFGEEYTWLSTLTGPARDCDVMLMKFSD